MPSDRINSILFKLQKTGALPDQDLKDLQSHIDDIEARSASSHGDSVQSSHFHGAALGLGSVIQEKAKG